MGISSKNDSIVNRVLAPYEVPDSVYYTTDYVKRLLIERHLIRARLENPGGGVVSSARVSGQDLVATDYTSVIGNTYHLDLIEAEEIVNTLPPDERVRLLLWCDGLTTAEAAAYISSPPRSIKRSAGTMARKRSLDKIIGGLNVEE